ncbi:uncharacterized protein LOC112559205 isoform X7 [Pomacea canaliculata]|uniref:uncharacterized protein LOC112559205 isoform X7 n=1 Tax=Pomacea canaliculata TaxID=400727 RepID=UPI000D72668A|nr:uncharacterized protein LOC112559205 isoform X7 [Pomacea canaliculata]
MRGVIKKMAERDLSFRAERSVRHFSSQSPFTIGFCSPPVTQHLHHPSPLQTCSPRGLLLQSDMFLCPMFLPETPSSVPGTSPCMSALPLPLPFDWTCQIERFHGVEAVSQYTERSMKHPGRMLETPVFELNNYLPVSLSTDQTSCSLPPPKSHKADANGKEIKLSTSLNPWASDFKPLKERQSMGNSNDIENLNQQTFVKSSQTSSIQICKLKLCRKDDAETKGSSSEGAICVAKEKWNESLQDITGNQYDDVSVQTDELHVIYTKESLHCAKDKTDNSSQTCSRNNGMLLSLRKEAETQTDNHYEHKSLQTEWVTEKQRLHSVDCSDSLQKIAEDLKKEVQKLQIEVCHLRAEQCIKELHRQILTLTQDKMLWQTYFVTGSEAESTVIGIIDERISWLHFEIKRLQKQLSQCLCKFEKGKILSRLPEFFLILPDNNVYRPAASARSASAKTAPSFSDILGSPLSSAGSQSLKSQKFKSQDASKKYMNLAVAESALRKPSQNSCHFSFEDKENLTVFDLQSSPVRQQSYHEHCPVLESSPTVCENGCKKPEKQNYSVTSQICTLDSSLHIITSKNPSLTEVINDDSAKYATCSALTETSDKENENQQFESMAKRMQSEVLVEKSSYNGATESVPGYCNEENTDKHPTKGYLQPSKKLTKTLPHEQTPSDSLKSREIEKPSLYPDAAVSAEDDHRGMSSDLYNPTSTSAMPTTFLQHHLQPLTLPAALQTTSHAELPSTDLQSSCAVASSMRLISSTLSELDFASDSNSSHSQEPSVQSSSTISSPLQQPGIPASSVIFSSPQGPGIPGLEEILSGTNSLSPCANDLYPIVLTMLTLEYPLQACDRVWLQKTAREQTQLLWTVLQNQQGPLSSLEAAVLKPPLTPGPSSAPASVPRSVTESPCHPQTTPDAPFANQTSLQMSPKTCDIPPGFQKIELQDSSWPGPAIAKKSDDDDDSSRAACQSGARVHKEGSDHPSTVHISHGSFIETPDPQLNSPTSSISLCKNSHDLEFELGCKIQTAGSADQNQTFLTKKNTLENACPTENSGAWEKTGKFCKMDEVKQEERHSKTGNANNLSASCHQKLVRFIMKTSPHLTPEQLSNVIVKVKEEFGGCLHGQLFSNITKKAKFIAMHSYPDVARSMNLASSSCAICHEEMKPQGLQKLTCGHFIHVQCFTKWVAQDRQCPTCQKLVSCPSFSY